MRREGLAATSTLAQRLRRVCGTEGDKRGLFTARRSAPLQIRIQCQGRSVPCVPSVGMAHRQTQATVWAGAKEALSTLSRSGVYMEDPRSAHCTAFCALIFLIFECQHDRTSSTGHGTTGTGESISLRSKQITYTKEKTGRVACNQPGGTSLLGRLLHVVGLLPSGGFCYTLRW